MPAQTVPQRRLYAAARLAVLAGAAWTVLAVWFEPDAATGPQRLLVALLALVAVAGAALLRHVPLGGIVVLLLCLAAIGGAGYFFALGLLAGVLLSVIWAALTNPPARVVVGFLLFGPGIAAGFFGIFAVLSFFSQQPLPLLPAPLNPPLRLADALFPLWLLPMAFVGAWMLLQRKSG